MATSQTEAQDNQVPEKTTEESEAEAKKRTRTTTRKNTRKAARKSTRKAATKDATEKTTAPTESSAAVERDTQEAQPKKTKKAGPKKTTKKAAAKKGTAKQSGAKKTTAHKAAGRRKKTVDASNDREILLHNARRLNPENVGSKIRVHQLARMLEVPSRELVLALEEAGLIKVAASNLNEDEVQRFLSFITPEQDRPEPTVEEEPASQPEEPAHEDEDVASRSEEEDAKLRKQVQSNVANEINQIEQKVEKELAQAVSEAAEEQASEDVGARKEQPASTPTFLAPRSGDDESAEEEADREQPRSRGRRSTRRSARRRSGDTSKHEKASNKETKKSEKSDGKSRTPENSERKDKDRSNTTKPDVSNKNASPQAKNTEDEELPTEPVAIKGSTRLEAQRRRRAERREEAKQRRHVLTEAEFLARRESVERTMVVCERERHDNDGVLTQIGVLEDNMLVEHFVGSESHETLVGNVYLGRVQNVLPAMEAAFIDIGQGRNGVLYAGELNWRELNVKTRRIEKALHPGDPVLVQVTKDPMGHKGARLTTQISLAGRYLVYVPGGRSLGISRKLAEPERRRLKSILHKVVPDDGGAIIRTAAESATEEAIATDVRRLHNAWEGIQERADKGRDSRKRKPITLYEEPDLLVRVVRDLFNEDFSKLVVDGKRSWNTVRNYVRSMAPDLEERLVRFDPKEHGRRDAFEEYRIDEQVHKAFSRVVWLPSGGSLVIEKTEAMTVIDVNTGRFTGSGGNLEETVTKNNLEAAEEIVRQLRLRDIGGMIVIDFIDMVLPENQDLVLRRLKETLARDRTRHQVSEVTSLGLVQLTRKRLGAGLLETFSTKCEECNGRGIIVHDDPVDEDAQTSIFDDSERASKKGRTKQSDIDSARRRSAEKLAQVREASEEAKQRRSIEELAAAVVVDDEQDDAESSVEQMAADAVARADAEDPDEPSGRDYVSDFDDEEDDELIDASESDDDRYEQALAEFESSPRRRRRTRGNSRSDRRPRREDFARPRPAKQDAREEDAAGSDVVSEDSQPERSAESRPGRRKRRRAVRLSNAHAKALKAERESTSGKNEAQDAPRGYRDEHDHTGPSPRRGGRRRATRRSSRSNRGRS